MDTAEIARRLAEIFRRGGFGEQLASYYSDEIVSVEPDGDPAETHGPAAVAAKVAAWFLEYSVDEVRVSGPYVHGERILFLFDIDMTPRAGGPSVNFQEAGIYTVSNGRIVEERFFFPPS